LVDISSPQKQEEGDDRDQITAGITPVKESEGIQGGNGCSISLLQKNHVKNPVEGMASRVSVYSPDSEGAKSTMPITISTGKI